MAVTRKDADIKTDVIADLLWDNRVDSTDIDVEVNNGVVTLSGKIPNMRAMNAALQDARLTLGVISVINDLKIEIPTEVTVPGDKEIAQRIEDQFLWDNDLNSFKLEADVTSGIVTISGTVDALWKKTWAEELASNVNGVVLVKNEIGVAPTKDFVDEDIAEEITAALDRRLEVNVNNVDVTVENGKVTLSGEVKDWSAWKAAYDAASFTAGVIRIKDNLEIKS